MVGRDKTFWGRKIMRRALLLLVGIALLLGTGMSATAQEQPLRDSTYVFTPSSPDLIQKTTYEPLRNAWGIDLLISNNGFGGGAFFRREFSDVLSGFITFAISDVKDDAEVELYNYYTGQTYVRGKINRMLLLPLTFGLQYRLFNEEIADNFRPYLNLGIGPSMVFASPYSRTREYTLPNGGTLVEYEQVEFFSSLKDGKAHYSIGGFVGGGAYFGLDRSTLTGVSFRYYFVPFRKGIESLKNIYMKQFGGFYITLNFGSFF